jgi:hypothetical protein
MIHCTLLSSQTSFSTREKEFHLLIQSPLPHNLRQFVQIAGYFYHSSASFKADRCSNRCAPSDASRSVHSAFDAKLRNPDSPISSNIALGYNIGWTVMSMQMRHESWHVKINQITAGNGRGNDWEKRAWEKYRIRSFARFIVLFFISGVWKAQCEQDKTPACSLHKTLHKENYLKLRLENKTSGMPKELDDCGLGIF